MLKKMNFRLKKPIKRSEPQIIAKPPTNKKR